MDRRFLVSLLVACGSPASNPTTTAPAQVASIPVSPVAEAGAPASNGKARIDLVVRKPSYFLGENVLVDFCVVNTSRETFEISEGGDYRGSSRSLRFKVQTRDASGALVADPDPNPMNFGGIGSTPKIEPGKKWCHSLPLMRYARIEAPGTYTITATHDLGWPEKTAPIGTATVKFTMPNATEAEAVVLHMASLPDDPETTSGHPSIDYADFSTLRFNAYVLPLAARAKAGDAHAIDGIAATPTEEATRALVILLGSPNPIIARATARGLAMRLPDPALNGALGKRNPFENSFTEQRKYLSQASWVPALAKDVLAAAKVRLASSDVQDQQDGAFMLEALGTPAESPDLIKALDAAIVRTRTVPAEAGIYPVPRGACQELLRAADMLVARGLAAPASPKSPGEIAIWLAALESARPHGWEAQMTGFLRHAIPYVRELALNHLPKNAVTPALAAEIAANLSFADADVVVAAAQIADREKLAPLAKKVAAAMPNLTGLRLNIVSNAAFSLGAKRERADVLVSLLAKKTVFPEAMSELVDLLQRTSGGRSSDGETPDAERAALQTKWKAYIAAHAAEINAGTKLPLDKTLVPSNWKLDGT